ncbi:MAG: transposase [Pyrinomonadaceae bacterium]|nr:transposase [Pyrinomonadaceae bacterium]
MSFLNGTLSQFWLTVQGTLFPWLASELGELSEKQQQLVKILELLQIESYIKGQQGVLGRPLEDRQAIGRAFVAKAVYNLETTRQLLERLTSDQIMRRLCGWERQRELPSEATFSRAFAEFAASQLPARVHEALIEKYEKPRLVGHISRDATAINGREKAAKKVKKAGPEAKPKVGGRKRAAALPKPLTRLERQQSMTLPEMLADLPKVCDCGTKRNSKGHPSYWVGYKLHLDVADGGIPISCILTSASVNDSQVAFPLATLTAQRVDNLYDLMDSAYDVPSIREKSIALGHVPLIDGHTRRGGEKPIFAPHEAQRYKERTTIERVFARLKEEFGGRVVRVRGPAKVMTSLLFGLIALTADQLLRLVS